MPSPKTEILEVLHHVSPQVADSLANQVINDPQSFISYRGASHAEMVKRVEPVMEAIIASFDQDNSAPLMGIIDRVFEVRLRTGYEPNVLLRVIDAVVAQCLAAVQAALPNDLNVNTTLRRKLIVYNNQCKLHLANLNLSIPLSERTELDPALLAPSRES